MMVWVEKRCFSLQCPADGCCRLLPGTTSVWLELKNPVIKHTTDGTFSIFHSILNKQPKTYIVCAGVFSNVTGNGEKRKNPLHSRPNCGSCTWPLIMKNAVRCSSPSSFQPWAYVRGVAHIGFGLMEADCSDRWRLEDSVLKGQIIVDFEPWWEEVTDTTSCPQDSAGVISAMGLITFTANLCLKTCLFNAFNYQKIEEWVLRGRFWHLFVLLRVCSWKTEMHKFFYFAIFSNLKCLIVSSV